MLEMKCIICGKVFSYYKSQKGRRYCSRECCSQDKERHKKLRILQKGWKHTEKTKKLMSSQRKGVKHTPEQIRKRVISFKKTISKRVKKLNLYNKLRHNKRYSDWHKEVIKRDGYKCVLCGSKKQLEVDHEISFASLFLEGRLLNDYSGLYDVSNGRVLCKECHKKTDSYMVKARYEPNYKLIKNMFAFYRKKHGTDKGFNAWYTDSLNEIGQKYLEKLQ